MSGQPIHHLVINVAGTAAGLALAAVLAWLAVEHLRRWRHTR